MKTEPKTTLAEAYAEASDSKLAAIRDVPESYCRECKAFGVLNHKADCSQSTMETLRNEVTRSQNHESHAGKRAAFWLLECRRMHSSLATLRHENNKLRAALKRMKEELMP